MLIPDVKSRNGKYCRAFPKRLFLNAQYDSFKSDPIE